MENSDFKVEVVEINFLLPHPNADRLEIAVIKGWNCVVGKGSFKKGDKGVYFPIDSILPEEVEEVIFKGTEVKLHKHRVKTIRLRGAISQGLLVPQGTVLMGTYPLGSDLTYTLGVTKHEPNPPKFQNQASPAKKKLIHPDFKKYTYWGNINNTPNLFGPDDEVIITEKIHGFNFRCGWLPYKPTGIWDKLKSLLRLNPKWQFVYGSHSVQISNKLLLTEGKNVYADIVNKYNLQDEMKAMPGLVIYGEIYGDGAQKKYSYGLKGERALAIFDIRDLAAPGHKYFSWINLCRFTLTLGVPVVPTLYQGPFGKANLKELCSQPSKLDPSQKIMEGAVVKSYMETNSYVGRKGAKAINPEYLLLKGMTDYH